MEFFIIVFLIMFIKEQLSYFFPTKEQKYWEQNLKESQKSIEEMKRKTYLILIWAMICLALKCLI